MGRKGIHVSARAVVWTENRGSQGQMSDVWPAPNRIDWSNPVDVRIELDVSSRPGLAVEAEEHGPVPVLVFPRTIDA